MGGTYPYPHSVLSLVKIGVGEITLEMHVSEIHVKLIFCLNFVISCFSCQFASLLSRRICSSLFSIQSALRIHSTEAVITRKEVTYAYFFKKLLV